MTTVATDRPTDMARLDDAEYEASLERLRAYVEQLEEAKDKRGQADRHADASSLDRATDLARVFEDKRWVDQVPQAKKRRGRRGVKPDSREQFFKWVKEHVKSHRTGQPLARSRSDQLLNAHEVVGYFSTTREMVEKYPDLTERAIRPLTKLRAGRTEEIPEVWRRAVELAEGGPPTAANIAKALADHDKALMPPSPAGESASRSKQGAAERYYKKVLADFDQFLGANARPAQTKALLLEIQQRLKARAGTE
jgi:hypothetical protein